NMSISLNCSLTLLDPLFFPTRRSSDLEELSEYWVDFLNKPQMLNNYRTIDEYWRENSFGKWGVDLDGFGPYKLEGNEFEYGLSYGNEMPEGFQSRDIKPEAMDLAQEDLDASEEEYDFTFILHAG